MNILRKLTVWVGKDKGKSRAMPTLNQLIRHGREEKRRTDRTRASDQCPQKQGVRHLFFLRFFVVFVILVIVHWSGLNPLRLLVGVGIFLIKRFLPMRFGWGLLGLGGLLYSWVENPALVWKMMNQDLNLPPEEEEVAPAQPAAPLPNQPQWPISYHQWAQMNPLPPMPPAAPWHHGGPLDFHQEAGLQLRLTRIAQIKELAAFRLYPQIGPNLDRAAVNAVVDLSYEEAKTARLLKVQEDLLGQTPERRTKEIMKEYLHYKNL